MTKYFLKDTPLAELERQMMTPPNFSPRGGGQTVLCRFRYRPEDVGLAEYSAQIMAEAPEPPTGPTM